jgi:ABC-2 type transport system ATP-binding protein
MGSSFKVRENSASLAVKAEGLSYFYGERQALSGVNLSIESGSLFSLVGPNGGGKSTTFKILSTLISPQKGRVSLFGHDIVSDRQSARELLGVVFQAPALDKKLSVWENLWYQGKLHGWSKKALRERIEELLTQFTLQERMHEKIETLSGGLKRRVEIAKALLPKPRMLILDEPSTGLDPLARRELWKNLNALRSQANVTILLTTHLLEEAEQSDKVALIDAGRIIAEGTPAALKAQAGGEVISLKGQDTEALKKGIEEKFQLGVSVVEGEIRIRKDQAHEFIPALVGAFPNQIESVRLGRPTLEDVFIDMTGRRLTQGASL